LVARGLLGRGSAAAAENFDEDYTRTLADLGSEGYLARLEAESRKDDEHMSKTIAEAMTNADIQHVLRINGATERDLVALYQRVEIMSVPPRLREEALMNPELVAFFLERSEPTDIDGEYCRKVDGSDTSITLAVWLAEDPGGTIDGIHRE